MQRILSLPVIALLALALSTLIANGTIDRRQTPPATATDIKPVTADSQSTGAETHPTGSANAIDSKGSSNTSALPSTGAASTGGSTTALPTTASSANQTNSPLGNSSEKSANTTKTTPPAGAKHSSAGQISGNFVATFVVASLSLFAALFT
ncbi:uncharacterized protein MELLADRAFT_123538 [Melampsora larici-populina 98AG31]|uniref:Secreted protein n=1 Tax=Melampsora larici-populina (strain 98AG31 / pathotype 3-4-7) TaxID=747676 RepID=F4RBC5_MELLP|nr:uncharacterized protein MELLADRAFT_123538 [Melampsora larici-populina 98AG31]EGG10384.1 secreted protein [Melampsora larici-populina 98AG31]